MRKKEDKKKDPSSGVAEGIDFDEDIVNSEIDEEIQEHENIKSSSKPSPDTGGSVYKKYYQPHPKVGARGGKMGRPVLDVKVRKVQVNITCTPEEKELYRKAAAKDNRNFPGFVNAALHEYIERHNLY